MMKFSTEDFLKRDDIDSLYRLVIAAARRANQVAKPESRPLMSAARIKKPTMIALEEILEGKVKIVANDEEEFVE